MGTPEKNGTVIEITDGSPSTSDHPPPTTEEPSKLAEKLEDIVIRVVEVVCLVCYIVQQILDPPKRWKKWGILLEWFALFCFTGFLVAILTVHKLQNHLIWEFELWKWCVMIMVLVCGLLVSEWIVNAVLLFTDCFLADKIRVCYFVYGLKKKHGVFVWWGLILLAWLLLVDQNEAERGRRWRSKETREILDYITRGIASLFVGAGIWLLKDLIVWSIAHSFQSENFFDRILKAMFHQFVIETLKDSSSWLRGYGLSYSLSSWAEEMKKGKVSAISIKLFIDVISSDDKLKLEGKNGEQYADRVTSEIFKNRPKDPPIITKKEFSDYKIKEDAFNMLFPDHVNDGPIEEEELKKWLRTVFQESKSLESSLNNARRAIRELEKIATGVVLVVIILVWLVVLKVLTTQAVVVILTQFFVLAFIFGDTCKRTFEGIFFLFATNPFDVGDRCFIEGGEEMFVKKINIQTTVFSRNLDDTNDEEQIVYPNSVLATKYIQNLHKHITDSVEFVIDAHPSSGQIRKLEAELKKVMQNGGRKIKDLRVHVNGFEDGEKIKMGVYVTHEHIRSDDEKREGKTVLILGLLQILKEKGTIIYNSSKTQQ